MTFLKTVFVILETWWLFFYNVNLLCVASDSWVSSVITVFAGREPRDEATAGKWASKKSRQKKWAKFQTWADVWMWNN